MPNRLESQLGSTTIVKVAKWKLRYRAIDGVERQCTCADFGRRNNNLWYWLLIRVGHVDRDTWERGHGLFHLVDRRHCCVGEGNLVSRCWVPRITMWRRFDDLRLNIESKFSTYFFADTRIHVNWLQRSRCSVFLFREHRAW